MDNSQCLCLIWLIYVRDLREKNSEGGDDDEEDVDAPVVEHVVVAVRGQREGLCDQLDGVVGELGEAEDVGRGAEAPLAAAEPRRVTVIRHGLGVGVGRRHRRIWFFWMRDEGEGKRHKR